MLFASGRINSAKMELVSLSPVVSAVGLDPKTSPTNGNVSPVTIEVNLVVPSSLGSLSSEYSSLRYSNPTNMATGPAGRLNISGLEALKSNVLNSLVSSLDISTIAGAKAVLTSEENIFIALDVESARPA